MTDDPIQFLRGGVYTNLNGKEIPKAKYLRGKDGIQGGWLPSDEFMSDETVKQTHLDVNLFPHGKLPVVFQDAIKELACGEKLSIEWLKKMNLKHKERFMNGDDSELTCGFEPLSVQKLVDWMNTFEPGWHEKQNKKELEKLGIKLTCLKSEQKKREGLKRKWEENQKSNNQQTKKKKKNIPIEKKSVTTEKNVDLASTIVNDPEISNPKVVPKSKPKTKTLNVASSTVSQLNKKETDKEVAALQLKLEEAQKLITKQNEELSSLKNQASLNQIQLNNLQETHTRELDDLRLKQETEINQQKENHTAESESLNQSIQNHKQSAESLKQQINKVNQEKQNIVDELESASTDQRKQQELQKQLVEKESQILSLNANHTTIKSQIGKLEDTIQNLKINHQNAEKKLTNQLNEQVKILEKTHSEIINRKNRELQELNTTVNSLTNQLSRQSQELNEYNQTTQTKITALITLLQEKEVLLENFKQQQLKEQSDIRQETLSFSKTWSEFLSFNLIEDYRKYVSDTIKANPDLLENNWDENRWKDLIDKRYGEAVSIQPNSYFQVALKTFLSTNTGFNLTKTDYNTFAYVMMAGKIQNFNMSLLPSIVEHAHNLSSFKIQNSRLDQIMSVSLDRDRVNTDNAHIFQYTLIINYMYAASPPPWESVPTGTNIIDFVITYLLKQIDIQKSMLIEKFSLDREIFQRGEILKLAFAHLMPILKIQIQSDYEKHISISKQSIDLLNLQSKFQDLVSRQVKPKLKRDTFMQLDVSDSLPQAKPIYIGDITQPTLPIISKVSFGDNSSTMSSTLSSFLPAVQNTNSFDQDSYEHLFDFPFVNGIPLGFLSWNPGNNVLNIPIPQFQNVSITKEETQLIEMFTQTEVFKKYKTSIEHRMILIRNFFIFFNEHAHTFFTARKDTGKLYTFGDSFYSFVAYIYVIGNLGPFQIFDWDFEWLLAVQSHRLISLSRNQQRSNSQNICDYAFKDGKKTGVFMDWTNQDEGALQDVLGEFNEFVESDSSLGVAELEVFVEKIRLIMSDAFEDLDKGSWDIVASVVCGFQQLLKREIDSILTDEAKRDYYQLLAPYICWNMIHTDLNPIEHYEDGGDAFSLEEKLDVYVNMNLPY